MKDQTNSANGLIATKDSGHDWFLKEDFNKAIKDLRASRTNAKNLEGQVFTLKKTYNDLFDACKELENELVLRTEWTNHHKKVSEIDAQKKHDAEAVATEFETANKILVDKIIYLETLMENSKIQVTKNKFYKFLKTTKNKIDKIVFYGKASLRKFKMDKKDYSSSMLTIVFCLGSGYLGYLAHNSLDPEKAFQGICIMILTATFISIHSFFICLDQYNKKQLKKLD